MSEVFFALVLFLLLCYLGILFSRLVFVYTIEQRSTHFCFVIIFALSTFIFCLVLVDAYKLGRYVFSVDFTTHALRLALVVDFAAIAVLCPFCILRVVLHNLQPRRCYALLACCGTFALFFRSWTLPLAWIRRLPGAGLPWDSVVSLWTAVTAVLALIGVTAVGVLSGYAAATTPIAFLRPLVVKNSGEEARAALSVLAKRQRHLLSLWVAKRCQIAEAYSGMATKKVGGGSKNRVWSWMKTSLQSTVRGGAHERNGACNRLREESDGIKAVSMAIFLQMSEMDSLVRSAESGTTWRGWVEAMLGVILLLHAFLKLLFTFVNLLRWCTFSFLPAGPTREDTATQLVRFLETYGLATSNGGEVEQRIVWVSLTLNVWMIVTSIRGLLLTVFRLVTTHTTFLSVDTTVLALTVGMGSYFVGQLLLLRLSPSLENESVLSGVLQEQLPRNDMYFHLNDLVFLVTSILMFLVQGCTVSSQAATLYSASE